MLISPKFKLLFVHIPKTAGCSVENMIKEQDASAFQTKYMHDSIINNRKVFDKYSNYYKFVIVRNSWQICASCYRFECQGVRWGPKNMTFKEWFNWKALNPHPNHHPFPRQLDYIRDDGAIVVDRICRFETLIEDIKKVCRDTGLNFNLHQRIHNYGRYDWRTIYKDSSDIKLVSDYCQEDIEYFNWKF